MISKLRIHRILAGMTIHNVSKLTGINQAKISFIERSLEEPTEAELMKLSAVMGFDVKEIRGCRERG